MNFPRVGHDWANTFTVHFHALEKEMATHSSVLAWRIPGMGEPGGLPSMGSHRVGHDWSDLAAAAAAAAAAARLIILVECSDMHSKPFLWNKTHAIGFHNWSSVWPLVN